MSWEDFVMEKIIKPLGMNRTRYEMEEGPEYSKLYLENSSGVHEEATPMKLTLMNPVGGMVSTAADLAKWVIFMINEGVNGENPLIPKKTFDEIVRQHMPISPRYAFPESCAPGYALGWETRIFRGQPVLEHDGGLTGASAHVTFLPRLKIGCATLANTSTKIGNAIGNTIYELFLKTENAPDWFARYKDRSKELGDEEKAKVDEWRGAKVEATAPSHALDAYCGVYFHSGYGNLIVSMKDGKLSVEFNKYEGDVEHLHYDHFILEIMGETLPLSFTTGLNGNINSLSIPFEPLAGAIVFDKT
jgi:hypothetical protein